MPTENDDIISVTTGANIYGLGGADQFTWLGDGAATIHGGETNESYDDNVYGDKTGGDRLFVETTTGSQLIFSDTSSGTVKIGTTVLTFDEIERIHLGSGNDTVRAGAATFDRHPLTIYTGAGDDNVVASSGGDFIDGGEGNDSIWAGEGDDFIQASRGNDLIYGGAGSDNIRWGQGTAEGNSGTAGLAYGNDTVYGGADSDVLNMWAHDWDDHDTLPGGAGVTVSVDKVFADGAARGTGSIDFTGTTETVHFAGFETLWTHQGRDVFDGSDAEIVGTAGYHANARWENDVLIGSVGNDTLEGGDGNDQITGGAGNDLLVGGGDFYNPAGGQDNGADTFVFAAGHGQDTIQGFEDGLDMLDLGGRTYTAAETSEGTVLTSGTDSILLVGVTDFDW